MDEYISREIAMERIKYKKPKVLYSEYGLGYERGLEDAIGLLNAISAADVQPVNQWISVKDRLPENAKPCAVVAENNGLGVSRYMGKNRFKWTLLGNRVLYWMPFPEPPKEE